MSQTIAPDPDFFVQSRRVSRTMLKIQKDVDEANTVFRDELATLHEDFEKQRADLFTEHKKELRRIRDSHR